MTISIIARWWIQRENAVSYTHLINTFYNDLFSKEICLNGKLNRKSKEFKIYSLISKNYIDKACNEGEEFPTDNYKKFMLITDYVSGMTDTYALNLYQELTGKPPVSYTHLDVYKRQSMP